jgi:hypothetical protein
MDVPPVTAPDAAPAPKTVTRKEAVAKFWQRGFLAWKLDAAQKLLYAEILKKRGADRLVVLCSRGWGKTFGGLLMCFEACLQKPNQQVAFVTKTMRQARANIRQSAETILEDCPRSLRPTYLKNDHEYVFKNGSVLSLLGVDSERFDTIRGRALDGCFIDEGQGIGELETVARVVLDPCVLRRRGWMVLAGTVPENGTHDFVTFVREAQATGHLLTKTILDCPRYTPSEVDDWKRRAGGETSSIWRREYLCEMTFSETRQVIPEWTASKAAELVREEPRPEYCHKYVGLDFGFARDLTVAIYGHWDFRNARAVIEDEVTVKGCTSAELAEKLEGKEEHLWGTREERGDVHRFADGNEARTIYELRSLHGLSFRPSEKMGKREHINALRLMVAQGEIVIHPRCTTLIRTLYGATWNKHFKSFDRDSEIGHADALDALLYLVRNIRRDANPVPAGQSWAVRDGFITPRAGTPQSVGAQSFMKAMAPPKSRPRVRRFGL